MKTSGQQCEVACAKNKANSGLIGAKRGTSAKKTSKRQNKTGKTVTELCGQPLVGSALALTQPIQVASTSFQKMGSENSSIVQRRYHHCYEKLKLQLFPIDEITRKWLEKDKHNPHLELTLGTRKRISSVVKHLNTKWGSSNPALGELILFPYDACLDNLSGQRRWTQKDSTIFAADVYVTIGNPAIFRLRYGWFYETRGGLRNSLTKVTTPQLEFDLQIEQNQCQIISDMKDNPCLMSHQECGPGSPFGLVNHGSSKPIALDKSAETVGKEYVGMGHNVSMLWADSSNISIGALLSEASPNPAANHNQPLSIKNSCGLQQVPFSCDSFDAAIAAHIARYGTTNPSSTQVSQRSLWEAEETCHAFPFQKATPSQDASGPQTDAISAMCKQKGIPSSTRLSDMLGAHLKAPSADCEEPRSSMQLQESDGAGLDSKLDSRPQPQTNASEECLVGLQSPKEIPSNEGSGLGKLDNCWPESLGPWLYNSNSSKAMLGSGGESVSISNLLANSLDAFHNCQIF